MTKHEFDAVCAKIRTGFRPRGPREQLGLFDAKFEVNEVNGALAPYRYMILEHRYEDGRYLTVIAESDGTNRVSYLQTTTESGDAWKSLLWLVLNCPEVIQDYQQAHESKCLIIEELA